MSASPRAGGPDGTDAQLARRLAAIDWPDVREALDARGHARLPRLLSAAACRSLARLYDDAPRFRKTVDLARHGFGGGGDYRYFADPLPPLVDCLRTELYPGLARIANAWQQRLGRPERYPPTRAGLRRRCLAAGQTRPTPLLLRYGDGGYNRLHQDLYGPVAFPFQVVVLLSEPERDFRGGELVLVERRPRMQLRADSVSLRRGEALIFPTRDRPIATPRGTARAELRHGVSHIEGERLSLGIIFHDAE